MRVLVTGAGGSAAFNFVDSLRLEFPDVYIVGVDASPYHLELVKSDKKYIVPPVNDPEYIGVLNRLIEVEKIDFVHPQPDVEVAFLCRNLNKVKAKLFLPPPEEVDLCHDKMKFNEVLRHKGTPVPEAYHVWNATKLDQAMSKLLKKHPKVWIRAIRGAGSKASLPIINLEQASSWINYWQSVKGLDHADFMVSEFLPGREFAWQSLWHEGKLVTSQARERIQYIFGNLTPSGQTSSPSVAKTVNRDDINRAGEQAVLSVSNKPNGVYCVDMKENGQGQPSVTEINVGRFFTTSNFFAHAGLNMPAMYLKLGMGQKLPGDLKKYNVLPDNLYWVRMVDMGYKLVKEGEWSSQRAK